LEDLIWCDLGKVLLGALLELVLPELTRCRLTLLDLLVRLKLDLVEVLALGWGC
jgi:hypothetical protein